MAKKVGKYPIPFDKNGNQLHYPELGYDYSTGVGKMHDVSLYRDNLPFEDTLTFLDYERGRSAAYFKFKRLDGTTVCVFLKEMTEIIPHMVNGEVTGTFAFVKRGKNYGCTLQA